MRGARLLVVVACVACGSAVGNSKTSGTPAGSPKFAGYAFRIQGKDTVPAKGARVWTSPPSDNVLSDTATGFWLIENGLVPDSYQVFAELNGVRGKTSKIQATLGKTESRIIVVLGGEETPWPSPVALDTLVKKITNGPSKSRP